MSKKLIGLCLCTIFLASCETAQDSTTTAGTSWVPQNLNNCQGASVSGTAIGTWNLTEKDSTGDTILMTLDIEASAIVLSVNCQYATGIQMAANANVVAQVFSSDISVPAGDTYSAPTETDSTGVVRTCTASIPTGVISYTLSGSCLIMNWPGGQVEYSH